MSQCVHVTEAVTAAGKAVQRWDGRDGQDEEDAGSAKLSLQWYLTPSATALVLSPPSFSLLPPPPLQLGLSQYCQDHVWLKKDVLKCHLKEEAAKEILPPVNPQGHLSCCSPRASRHAGKMVADTRPLLCHPTMSSGLPELYFSYIFLINCLWLF